MKLIRTVQIFKKILNDQYKLSSFYELSLFGGAGGKEVKNNLWTHLK